MKILLMWIIQKGKNVHKINCDLKYHEFAESNTSFLYQCPYSLSSCTNKWLDSHCMNAIKINKGSSNHAERERERCHPTTSATQLPQLTSKQIEL